GSVGREAGGQGWNQEGHGSTGDEGKPVVPRLLSLGTVASQSDPGAAGLFRFAYIRAHRPSRARSRSYGLGACTATRSARVTTRSWCASCRRHTNLAQRSGVAPASKSGRDSGRRRVAGSASQHSRRLCTANGVAVLLTATRCLFSSKPRTCVLILFQVTALHPLLTFTALAGAFKMSSTMISKAGAQIRIYKDPEELALKAARGFARLADQYVVGSGRFTVALAGGSTPKAMLSLLAQTPFRETVPWSSIH